MISALDATEWFAAQYSSGASLPHIGHATICWFISDTKYLDILNVTAVSIPRMLSAILENSQQEDGNINIPHNLRSYMQGITKISPEKKVKKEIKKKWKLKTYQIWTKNKEREN